MLRTHTCGELNTSNIGQKVVLAGWVNSVRNHGGLVFVDLRDRYGLIQVKFNQSGDQDAANVAEKLHNEWVIKVTSGRYGERQDGNRRDRGRRERD